MFVRGVRGQVKIAILIVMQALSSVARAENGRQQRTSHVNSGIMRNGYAHNGIMRNGAQLNGIRINGISLNGSQVSGKEDNSSRAHADGAMQITGVSSDGGSYPMMLVRRSNRGGISYKGKFYKNHRDVWWNQVHWQIPHAPNRVGEALSASTPNVCVQKVVAAMPDCGVTAWSKACVVKSAQLCTSRQERKYARVNYGEPICGYDAKGKPREVIFIGGAWDDNMGSQGAGGKSKDAASGEISIGCRGVGALAKCVDYGYKPWVSPALDAAHQACVRMVRGDFCGDGTPWTVDGNLIDVEDIFGIQKHEGKDWVFEATWTKDGATFKNAALDFRVAEWGAHPVNPHIGMTFADYQKTHPYCAPKAVTQLVPSGLRATTPVWALTDTAVDDVEKPLRTKRPIKCPPNHATCGQGL